MDAAVSGVNGSENASDFVSGNNDAIKSKVMATANFLVWCLGDMWIYVDIR